MFTEGLQERTALAVRQTLFQREDAQGGQDQGRLRHVPVLLHSPLVSAAQVSSASFPFIVGARWVSEQTKQCWWPQFQSVSPRRELKIGIRNTDSLPVVSLSKPSALQLSPSWVTPLEIHHRVTFGSCTRSVFYLCMS